MPFFSLPDRRHFDYPVRNKCAYIIVGSCIADDGNKLAAQQLCRDRQLLTVAFATRLPSFSKRLMPCFYKSRLVSVIL